MDRKMISETERNNKMAMTCHTVEAVIIAVSLLTEALMARRTMIYALIVIALALVPVAGELFFWNRDHETMMIKHLMAIGFAIMYSFLIFTTTNHMVFVYVIPMIVVISVFGDTAYSLKIVIGTTIESFIVVIGGALTGAFGFRDMESALLQLFVMTMMGIFSFFTARTLEMNNRQKLENVQAAQNETEKVLGHISDMSEQMKSGISDIHEKVGQLQNASQMTREAMQDVTSGAGDTAEAVQNQLMQTAAIQQKVELVSSAAEKISDSMNQTLSVLENGSRDIEKLVSEVETSVKNGADVAAKLETLDQYIEEMNSIVEIISGITSQTSLLSLNASIEAARAGEAGKGFAVVAGEISGMAKQTADATAHITELINNVSGAISQVVSVIRGMIEGINAEKDSTANTAESFGTIEKNTYEIRDNVSRLTETVEELKTANQEIADSVQTISAISEEVSAHANETLTAEESNMSHLITIADKAQKLLELTQK